MIIRDCDYCELEFHLQISSVMMIIIMTIVCIQWILFKTDVFRETLQHILWDLLQAISELNEISWSSPVCPNLDKHVF